jgi:protein-S-isoprenylcysteine O-methyltransferase Ste14
MFVVGTVLLVRFSRRALTNPEAHGFYRFFVFEGILVLVLLNQPCWFRDPFSPQHLLSWLLLGASIYLVVQSFFLLRRLGGRVERSDMPENHAFENTGRIVDEGLYRYIRHPMYASLLYLGWGAFLKQITFISVILIVLVTVFVIIAARVEERENLAFFGSDYFHYMQRTKMFIPYIV